MALTFYHSNDVKIQLERTDQYESKVTVNGKYLITISNETKEEFMNELVSVFEKHRI